MSLARAFFLIVTLVVIIPSAACNALLGVEDVELETPEPPGETPVDPPPPPPCNVASNFGLISSNPTTSVIRRRSDGGSTLTFLLNADAKPDSVSVMLYANSGGHGVIETSNSSHPLYPSDTKFESCGICAFVNTDFDRNASTFAETFMAQAQGTLNITTATSTRLAGSLRGLKFRHVDISNGSTTEVPDHCTVTIDNVVFDMTYPPIETLTDDSMPPAML